MPFGQHGVNVLVHEACGVQASAALSRSKKGIAMHRSNVPQKPRRSSRVPIAIPVLVTSLDPDACFSQMCETMVVSAHGCAIQSPMKLQAGSPMNFQIGEGRRTVAHVVDCRPIGQKGWMVAAKLERPENFWGLKPCPEDWMQLAEVGGANGERPPKMPMLRSLVAEMVEPLQAEVAELRDKLAGAHPGRSSFEVSLSHIPPEVEEKLWIRLRQDLGAQVLQQTREQSEHVLEAAKVAIEQKIAEGENEFRQRSVEQLQGLEQRAKGVLESIPAGVRQQVRAGLEEIDEHMAAAAARIGEQGNELVRVLQQRLSEEHEAHRRSVQQVQAGVTLESSRLQTQVTDLGGRVAKLDEAARGLESDLESRLAKIAAETVSGAGVQLQNAMDGVLTAQLMRLNEEITGKLLPLLGQGESLNGDIRATTDALRTENERAAHQIAAVREAKQQFQQWIDQQVASYKAELHARLEQEIYKAASTSAAKIEDELKTSLAGQLEAGRASLNAELERLVSRARSLEQSLVQETEAWLVQQGSGFQKQLQGTLSDADGRIRARIDLGIQELATGNAKELGKQLDEASARLKNIQTGIQASMAESLSSQVTQTLEHFEHTMEQLAQGSVGRWRSALGRDLNSLAKMLGDEFRSEAAGGNHDKR